MAGIGFELKKIINDGSITSFLKASFSGIFIVAGPWMFSIVTLSSISYLVQDLKRESIDDFFSILIYIFSFSIIISGGFQYLITRLFSDYIYNKKVNEALYFIEMYMLITGIISFIITFILSYLFIGLDNGTYILFLLIALASSSVNILWIIIIFATYLKWFLHIALSFVLGIGFIVLNLIINKNPSLNFILFIYGIGNFITIFCLYLISHHSYKPKKIYLYSILDIIKRNIDGLNFLFLTGLFYYLYIWIDKILYWIYKGSSVGKLDLNLYLDYDLALYIANLTLIPGLVFFVIVSETDFFIYMKKFLLSLQHSDYRTIKEKMVKLGKTTNRVIISQFSNQLLITISVLLFVISYTSYSRVILTVSFVAVYFQLIIFSYLNFLFYMERYRETFKICSALFILNLVLTWLVIKLNINIPGLSYLITNIIGTIFSISIFNKSIIRLDRYIYMQNSK
ncbi:MAG: exopolysaccharide Pel transporter PelG [Spirochaetales bacterium]|nr:exopolysaccharide Pel transporter PelG [Spirochaetales bacterium]